MSDQLLDKMRGRAFLHLSKEKIVDPLKAAEVLDSIIAEVETALVLARREGFAHGARWQADKACVLRSYSTAAGEEAFPLPTRTRQVLREEPDPHGYAVRYCYSTDRREIMVKWEPAGEWMPVTEVAPSYANMLRPTAERVDLWASLKAEPYRTEEVFGDESDPWGEGGGT